jgi:methionine synthase I (cobalamin-dependent)
MWITEAGREAIDAGGVAAAEAAQQVPQAVTNTFNMAGSGNVFATATAPGATATANVSNFNLQHAKTFAAAVRAVESDLDLTDDDRADLAHIETVEQGDDLRLAQRATARLYESADKIATGTASGILLALAKQALGIEG